MAKVQHVTPDMQPKIDGGVHHQEKENKTLMGCRNQSLTMNEEEFKLTMRKLEVSTPSTILCKIPMKSKGQTVQIAEG